MLDESIPVDTGYVNGGIEVEQMHNCGELTYEQYAVIEIYEVL